MTMFLPGGGTIINHRNDYKRYRSTWAVVPGDTKRRPHGVAWRGVAVAAAATAGGYVTDLLVVARWKSSSQGGSRHKRIPYPMVNSRSALGQKHGHRGKTSFFHQIIFRKKTKSNKKKVISFCSVVGFRGAVPPREVVVSVL